MRGLSELGARYGLSAEQVAQLQIVLDHVTEAPDAPTTVTDVGPALRDHLADSLVGLDLDRVRGATTIADLGAGAGFPGLPLAVALPEATVHLVESVGRKCGFMQRVIDAAEIPNAVVVCARAEEWTDGMGRCDIVTARALAPLPVLAEYAAPLLRDGGALVAWRGRRDPSDEAAGSSAAAELGLEVLPVQTVTPYPGALHRHLHELVKTRPTPSRFPRRAGMARKRPLGASSGRDI